MNALLISLGHIVHIGIPVLTVFSVVGLIISLLVRNKQAQIENCKLVNKELVFKDFSTNDLTKKAQAFLTSENAEIINSMDVTKNE